MQSTVLLVSTDEMHMPGGLRGTPARAPALVPPSIGAEVVELQYCAGTRQHMTGAVLPVVPPVSGHPFQTSTSWA